MTNRCHRVVRQAAVAACPLAFACAASAQTSFVGANFIGSSFNQSFYIPPDTMGAIGPDHFVELINGRYAVYSRTGTVLVASTLHSFFTSAGVSTSSSFDPRVVYDPGSGRWFAVAADNARNGNSSYLMAVSKTSNPLSGWDAFRIDADSTNASWIDFPTLGFNRDAVVLGGNLFPVNTGSVYTSVVVLPKAGLLAATPTVAGRTNFQNINPNDTGYAPQPAIDRDGSLPLSLLSDYNTPAGYSKRSTVTGTAASPTLATAGGFVTFTGFNPPPTVDQPGAKENLNSGDNRFSGNVVMANGSLWAVQGIDSGGRAAVRWLRINPATDTLIESGVIADPSLGFSFPSIAVNEQGAVVVGFSGASSSQYVSTYAVVGRTSGAGTGTTTFGTPFLTKAGVADYQRLDSINRNRWGDYSATTQDPTDPGVFWTIQEWVSATDAWSTQVTEIIVPNTNEVRWKNAASGAYGTGSNWLAGGAPASTSDVVFSLNPSTYTATVSGSVTAASLTARRGSVTLSLGAGNTLALSRTSSAALNVADYNGTATLTLPAGTLNAPAARVGYTGGGTGTLNITGAAVNLTGTLTVANANSTVNLSAGSLTVGATTLTGTLNHNGGILSAGTVGIPGGRLNVAAGGTRTLRVTGLSISAGGRLDLNDNDAVINYTGTSPLSTVPAYLLAGYNAGNWDGAGGIDSTSAKNAIGRHTGVASAEASLLLGLTGSQTITWSGATVDATSILLKYTWYGDANLDGLVNADDYVRIDRGYARNLAAGTARWTDGDYNYDGSVTGGDYLLMDSAFVSQTGALPPELAALRAEQFGTEYVAHLIASVPEPSACFGFMPAILLLGRRRRRHD